jgi:diguanylate cyclase (GGDEF)-like protein
VGGSNCLEGSNPSLSVAALNAQPPPVDNNGVSPTRLQPAERGRALALLFAAGGALVLLTIALPHGRAMEERSLMVIAGVAIVASAAIRVLHRRLTEPLLHVAVGAGTILIGWAILAGGDPGTDFAFTYLWVALYAYYFFSRKAASLQLALVAGCYGAVLALEPTQAPYTTWLLTVGSLAVGGLVLASLRRQSTSLMAELTVAAGTDSLTGLPNRRSFFERARTELSRCRRTGQPLSLLLCDVDRFKTINDTFGHQRGDEVLCQVAAALSVTVRASDFVGRLGGEEFALLLPDTDADGAAMVAECACESVREGLAEQGVALSISIGSTTCPRDGVELDALMHASDVALYAAKAAGRDRWVAH